MIKPGSRDIKVNILITGEELDELQKHTWSMVEAFGLDRRIEQYKGKKPIGFYRSPEMWLDDDAWVSFSQRFSVGSSRPHGWPKPDIVSICTSPEFVNNDLLHRLLNVAGEFMTTKQKIDTVKKSKCRTKRSN